MSLLVSECLSPFSDNNIQRLHQEVFFAKEHHAQFPKPNKCRISEQNCQPLTSYDESNREWFEGFNGPQSSPNAPISLVQVHLHKYIQCITILILPQSPWHSFHILLVLWADMIHSGQSASPKVLGNLAVEKGASSTLARSSKSGFGNRILSDRVAKDSGQLQVK